MRGRIWLINFGLVDYRTQRKKLRPLSARSNIPWSEVTGEDPQLGLRMTELTAGRGHTPHNKEVTVVPERKNNERVYCLSFHTCFLN